MAVIITDMIIPVSCAWCVFGQRIDNENTMCLRHPMEIPSQDMDSRPSHCPLKEVDDSIRKQDPLSNFQIPDKCKYCGYYYNFMCRAEQCIKDGVIT